MSTKAPKWAFFSIYEVGTSVGQGGEGRRRPVPPHLNSGWRWQPGTGESSGAGLSSELLLVPYYAHHERSGELSSDPSDTVTKMAKSSSICPCFGVYF